VTSSATIIDVSDASLLASNGFINLESETIYYANVTDNQLINCARGQNGTTAASHLVTTIVYTSNLPSINVWPTPNSPGSQYMFVYWRLRRLQDAGNGVTEQDIPFRFLPCMVSGLAYYIAMKKPEVDPNRVMALKALYEEQFQLAADEDREKAAIRFVPRQMFY